MVFPIVGLVMMINLKRRALLGDLDMDEGIIFIYLFIYYCDVFSDVVCSSD
jgi:hypothetical protein